MHFSYLGWVIFQCSHSNSLNVKYTVVAFVCPTVLEGKYQLLKTPGMA